MLCDSATHKRVVVDDNIICEITKMQTIIKVSIWVVVVVLAGGHLGELLQSSLLDSGIISKPIEMKDACKLKILPNWFEKALGCEEKTKKPKVPGSKPKLNLGGDVLKKYKFENREKSLSEKLTDCINKAFVFAQRLVLPEKFVLPCILGDCDMDKKIQKEKEQYTNLLSKTVPVTRPESVDKKTKNIPMPDVVDDDKPT